MKQVIQHLSNGETEVVETPVPSLKSKHCLIQTSATLISAGTEKMLVNFGKASYLQKARQQPDKVKEVFQKIKTDGLLQTYDAVKSKLDQPIALGYCNVGKVLDVGKGDTNLKCGDRVVSNGPHADMVCVPQNLCAKIPDNVSDEQATFTVIGAIALQGIRLASPTLGETFVVAGLGLVGLMAIQLLIAQGCRVIGLDFDEGRLNLAKKFGAEVFNLSGGQDPVDYANLLTKNIGVDGVLITASTTSSEPVSQAAHMCRKRGRIILVGVTGLELSRADFYEKELSFQVSCSYGPGRYDDDYEKKGLDYPLPYVRWTEQRNFEAVLQMMAMGKVNPTDLITHRYSIEQADKAYNLLSEKNNSLGIILKYQQTNDSFVQSTINVETKAKVDFCAENLVIGAIGAGNYASRVLLPAFSKSAVSTKVIASSGGLSATYVAKKLKFNQATSNSESIFTNESINTVVIATPHTSHAGLVVKALESGKHVFVEKPLAATLDQLKSIQIAYNKTSGQHLMVGFNRRFSPFVIKVKKLLKTCNQPKSMVMTVNAGAIPVDHWTQKMDQGAGRVIGEACHFIDLLRYLIGVPISSWHAEFVPCPSLSVSDITTFTLKFIDGSIGTIHYFANGHKSVPKEKLQIFTSGKVLELNNYRKLTGYGWRGFKSMSRWRMDKGQQACVNAFVSAIKSGMAAPIAFEELLEVSRVTLEIHRELYGHSL